ncbi:MAG: TonB-dependent receptor [Gemmatimonadales bacterium]|nr:MAG: TonB-dependent receptor [Gemmatimonadales bacterium]
MPDIRSLAFGSCIVAVAVLLPAVVHAQAGAPPTSTPAPADTLTPPAVLDLPTIEVVGRDLGAVLRQTGTVHTLSLRDVEALRPVSTEDALRRLPGINTKSEEETSIISNIGLRGLSAGEAKSLLLEDGVPVAPGLLIGNDRYFNPRIQRVERVEVLKGSSSLRYGPSTIGGVVNFITRTPEEGTRLSARTGSFGMNELMMEAGSRSSGGTAYAGVVGTHSRSDGFMDKGYRMNDLMVKAGLSLGDRHRLGLKLSWYENDANISYRGHFLDDFLAGASFNPAPDDVYLTGRRAVDLNHRFQLGDRAVLSSVAYWSNLHRDYWRYSVDTDASNAAGRWVYTDALTGNNRSFDRFGLDSRLKFEHDLLGVASDAEFGVRGFHEESDDRRIRATRAEDRMGPNDRHRIDSATSLAIHLHNRVQLTDRIALTPGVRMEAYEQEREVLTGDDPPPSTSTSNTEFLPGLGGTFTVSPAVQLYGGIYRAFSPASNGVALDGMTDQLLEAERSTNLEVGVRGSQGALQYELAVFRMDFQNQVVTGNTDPRLSRSNAGATLHQGAEVSLGYGLTEALALSGNVTWVPTSRFESGENAGNRIPYTPRVMANLALDIESGPFRSSLLVHHRGEQFGDETNLREIPDLAEDGIWGGLMPSYTTLDLTGEWRAVGSVSVFGAVKNLTDERFITGLRQGIYVGPERSFELGMQYTL